MMKLGIFARAQTGLNLGIIRSLLAEMVKLVDTLASGASGISSRGGSSPLLGIYWHAYCAGCCFSIFGYGMHGLSRSHERWVNPG